MDEEAQFQAEYKKALAMCGDSILQGLVKDLCLADARALESVLRELRVGVPRSKEELPLVHRTAHRCARVVDCATDPEWFPGSQDYQPLAEQIDNLAQKGVPSAPLVLTVLAARFSNSWRDYLSLTGSPSTGTLTELGREEEEDYTQLVQNIVDSVTGLHRKLFGVDDLEGAGESGKVDANGPFPASYIRLWWGRHGQELAEMQSTLTQASEADRERFRLRLSQREPFMPGNGERDGHYPAAIYVAVEESLRMVRKHWRQRDAVSVTKQLFSLVGIELTEASIQQARRRKRKAKS